jgi:2-dehydro-3-deoxygalactonokinase
VKEFLAVDWGTTNLRAWRVGAKGQVLEMRQFPLGVSQIASGEVEQVFARHIRPKLHAECLPALMCGMVGSNLGWRTAPYVDCPAGLSEIESGIMTVARAPSVRIIPGLRCQGLTRAPDVMRGEETQLLGWAAQIGARGSGRHIICHPGTHAKWALLEEGRVTRFVTAMTGELFDVLCKHSVLRTGGEPDDANAFSEGLDAAGDGQALAARLFSARARVVGAGADAASTRSYLSGLLIGAEVASMHLSLDLAGASIWLVGDAALRQRYRQALNHWRHEAKEMDGEEALLAGMLALVRGGALNGD